MLYNDSIMTANCFTSQLQIHCTQKGRLSFERRPFVIIYYDIICIKQFLQNSLVVTACRFTFDLFISIASHTEEEWEVFSYPHVC